MLSFSPHKRPLRWLVVFLFYRRGKERIGLARIGRGPCPVWCLGPCQLTSHPDAGCLGEQSWGPLALTLLCPLIFYPKVFVELNELLLDKNQEPQWRETARWIKFEEDVEEETERWGKPHVASLSFRSLLELRRTLAHGNLPCPPPTPPQVNLVD